jgi:hypothetical protein
MEGPKTRNLESVSTKIILGKVATALVREGGEGGRPRRLRR